MKQNLMKIPLFAQMEHMLERKKYFKLMGAFDLLSTLFEVEQFKKKEAIFKAGDPGDKFYVVCEGCVRISSSDTPNGKELTLNLLTKDKVFGEIALLKETTRTATASAFEPTILLSITREKFESLLEVFPRFEEIMLPVLEERTGNTLKLLPPFDKLDKKRRNMVGQMSQFTSYMTGMTVVKENDKYNGLFLLVEGTVKVSL
jgi:CRP-like cAMP-binding protein